MGDLPRPGIARCVSKDLALEPLDLVSVKQVQQAAQVFHSVFSHRFLHPYRLRKVALQHNDLCPCSVVFVPKILRVRSD
jgi:hypothetical protein